MLLSFEENALILSLNSSVINDFIKKTYNLR